MMQSLRCVRAMALARPGKALTSSLPTAQHQSMRSLSILTPRRPQFVVPTALPAYPSSASSTPIPSATTPDVLPKISAHPGLSSMQVRCGPRDTYNMTHRVRKRRFGFLARLNSKKGKKVLQRRTLKGRKNMAHR